MSEVTLSVATPPSSQFVIPSVKEVLLSYVRAYGFEPVDDDALTIEGDSAIVSVLLEKQGLEKQSLEKQSLEKQRLRSKTVSTLMSDRLSIRLDQI